MFGLVYMVNIFVLSHLLDVDVFFIVYSFQELLEV